MGAWGRGTKMRVLDHSSQGANGVKLNRPLFSPYVNA